MAEFVATKLAEALVAEAIRRISDLLVSEATVLSSAREQVETLRVELTRVQCFLEDADRKQDRDKRVQNWLAEVGAVAAQIEDVIDTYVYHANSSPIRFFRMRKLRAEIRRIKEKLSSIRESRQTYQIEFSSAGDKRISSLRSLRRSHPEDDDGDVVGFEKYATALKGELMKEEDRRRVVSVVGMGGLGKTTLAKSVYDDLDVKKHFDCCAWAYVSQEYVPREIFSEILMQIGFQDPKQENEVTAEIAKDWRRKREILKSLKDHDLILLVKNELREKRYLVVLDDIWSLDAWYSVHNALPDGKRGSKVVFTTRNKEVAVSADPQSSPIEPPLLTSAESWELLRRKVFPKESFLMCPSPLEFEQLGREMVESCSGLPLAVVVLGGLLRTKSSLDDWSDVLKVVKLNIGKLRSEQRYGVENILELSFRDLPYYLRSCFLYLGIFPEDCEIPKRKLIQLWMAEGFLPDSVGEELIEDEAERCLEELVGRCMVQVAQQNHTGKGFKTCRLHDLMRDFCIAKSKEENFFEGNTSFCGASRRISIHGINGSNTRWADRSNPHLRSLLVSGMNSLTTSLLRRMNLSLLRVLHLHFILGEFAGSKLPVGVGGLIHLRYLKFSCALKTLELPHSLGNLRNLRTLDLAENLGVLLPNTMSGLIHLRHLLLPVRSSYSWWILRSINLFGNIPLTHMETLKWISANDLIRSKASLTLANIRVLGVRFKNHQEYNTLVPLLTSQLVRLRSFKIKLDDGELPNLKLLSQCEALSRLFTFGKLSREAFSSFPRTLSKLELLFCVVNKDRLAIMEKLPNLRILRLRYTVARGDKKLVFSSGGFPKLERLLLYGLVEVEELEVEEGAMSKLERLDIDQMLELVMLPEGLKYMSSLRELNIRLMKKSFADRARVNEDGVEGDDFHKVRHIPVISISSNLEPLRLRF